MRWLPALLLLALLPGLLLPAGFVLHLCGCEQEAVGITQTAGSAQATKCCSKATTPTATRSHCCQLEPTDRDDQERHSAPCSHCHWLTVPDDQPEPNLPEASFPPLPGMALLPAPPLVPAALAVAERSEWPTPANRPPPPDQKRNLPLLL